MMRLLFVIPARSGSKGIPRKNIKPLNHKPLIHYSIEFARLFTEDENICLSTDSEEISSCAMEIKLAVPFLRPEVLSSDTAGSFGVLQHALAFYENNGKHFEGVVLLQPTSPFREKWHLEEALNLYSQAVDMVVSVKLSKGNPYFNLFEENDNGFLKLSKGDGYYNRRQDLPEVYEFNGSIYIINPRSLRERDSFQSFDSVKKYLMPEEYSIDLDTPRDWNYAEFLLSQ
jgi:CMP-N,N'-diacetyllegionaminic acid synthase